MRSLFGEVLEGELLDPVNKAPVPYVSRRALPTYAGLTAIRDIEQQLRTYGTVGTLFGIVNGLALDTSQVEWKLWRKAPSGLDEDRVEVTDHRALSLVNKPNRHFTGQLFREAVQQHLDLVGEGWTVIARNGRSPIPAELWPVRPDRMAPVPDPEEYIAGYQYTSPSGERVPLETRDVARLMMPNPDDTYRGLGPVQALLREIDSAKYSAEWNRNFFINGAEPGGIIEAQARLSDTEWDEFTERWREQHQGVANAHRVAVLERMKWVDRKFSQRDMQFVELRQVTGEIIREAFRYPKSMLGSSDDVNRAVAEAQTYVYAQWMIVPRLRRWKAMYNEDHLPLYGPAAQGLEFDFVSPVPADREAEDRTRESKATAAKTYIDAGFSGDSVKEALTLPSALVYVGPPSQAPAPQPPANALPTRAVRQLSATHAPTLLAQLGPAWGVVAQDDEPDLTQVQQDFEQALDNLLDDWQGISEDQRAELERQIRDAVEGGELADLAALGVDAAAAAALLAAAMIDLAALAAGRVVDEAAEQDVTIPAGVASAAILTAVAATTAALLAAGLATAAGREALRLAGTGRSGREVARQVDEYLAGLSDAGLRSQLGGALWHASNAGRMATLDAAPGVELRISEVLDKNTCSPCRKVDGRRVTIAEATAMGYATGGYLECQGRERCRGAVVPTWHVDQD